MPDEIIDIFDENNKHLNIQKNKSEAHRDGLWHRSAQVWIYNPNGEIMLQLRGKDKALYPGMWDISAAGHVAAGEEPLTSAVREIEEEIGLKIKEEDLAFFKIEKFSRVYKEIKNNEFCYAYFYRFDGDIKGLKLQAEEVDKVVFLPIDKIEKDLEKNPEKYVPHGKYWYEVFEEVKKKIIDNK